MENSEAYDIRKSGIFRYSGGKGYDKFQHKIDGSNIPAAVLPWIIGIMPGVHEKFLDGQTGSRRCSQCFCIRDRANFRKCRTPPDIFFCSADLADKFFNIKKCSLVPAFKDGFISGKVGEKFFVRLRQLSRAFRI